MKIKFKDKYVGKSGIFIVDTINYIKGTKFIIIKKADDAGRYYLKFAGNESYLMHKNNFISKMEFDKD